MVAPSFVSSVLLASLLGRALSVSITDIQGDSFLSPFVGQTVTDVQGAEFFLSRADDR